MLLQNKAFIPYRVLATLTNFPKAGESRSHGRKNILEKKIHAV
jgi:hypothetical protein